MSVDKLVELVDETIRSRHSVRAYLDRPVPADTVSNILDVAARAPTSTNMQPWRVYVLTGAALRRMTDKACAAFDAEPDQHKSEFPYYPAQFFEPYLSRRRKLGFAMYDLVGIQKGDKERMRLQHRRNLEFFDAPVGLLFTLNRQLPQALFIDYGAFFQNIMIAARARGLDTCMQLIWADMHRVVEAELKLGADEMLIAGMALGYADPDALINRLRSERQPAADFATFLSD